MSKLCKPYGLSSLWEFEILIGARLRTSTWPVSIKTLATESLLSFPGIHFTNAVTTRHLEDLKGILCKSTGSMRLDSSDFAPLAFSLYYNIPQLWVGLYAESCESFQQITTPRSVLWNSMFYQRVVLSFQNKNFKNSTHLHKKSYQK